MNELCDSGAASRTCCIRSQLNLALGSERASSFAAFIDL